MSDGNPAEADTTSILTHMREMRTYLAGEIDRSTKIMQADLMALGTRTAALETRVDDMADAHNAVVDGTNMLLRRVEDIELQMEDLSNRTRRNNLRIRGLPEGAGEGSLADLVRDLLRPLAPDLPDQAWILDRAHRALRARRAEDERPRDVIVRFLHYSTKELILRNNRGASISYEGTPILLFQDLTPITLQRRREWKPVADLLRNHKIQFAWGHPLKILAFLDGRTHVLQPGWIRADSSKLLVSPPRTTSNSRTNILYPCNISPENGEPLVAMCAVALDVPRLEVRCPIFSFFCALQTALFPGKAQWAIGRCVPGVDRTIPPLTPCTPSLGLLRPTAILSHPTMPRDRTEGHRWLTRTQGEPPPFLFFTGSYNSINTRGGRGGILDSHAGAELWVTSPPILFYLAICKPRLFWFPT
uniref:Uncharacterized protein n=1 Tax=Leptobrachium leishanense TaxID=445787 RepID=A0A8C5PDH8_9ANUR